mmetsp:Transcript_43949/g.80308  ORF Transcript_43949/g.80308 Transcript_43949/m.80308 type:complete len:338 (-) Transcript_43949:97-1110(-)
MSLDQKEERHDPGTVGFGVVIYMLFSSCALVANKMVMDYVDASGFVFCLQILATLAFIALANFQEFIHVDPLRWNTTLAFAPYIASFSISLYSNGKALAASNVETVIVFRACAPLLVSLLDWCFLGRELPSRRSFAALLGMIGGAICYVLADSEFAMSGISAYKWVTINLFCVVFEMAYGKGLLQGIEMESPVWGATLYTNLLALLPMFLMGLAANEQQQFRKPSVHRSGFLEWLIVSCILGIGISWSGWYCRNMVSATVYTILGVLCKLLSVAINMMLGKKHATLNGLLALLLTVISSALYQQAPLRARAPVEKCHEASSLLGETPRTRDDKKESV